MERFFYTLGDLAEQPPSTNQRASCHGRGANDADSSEVSCPTKCDSQVDMN